MRILNLGCGSKVSLGSEVINIDWSPYLLLKTSRLLRKVTPLFLDAERRRKLNSMGDNVKCYNLAKGIPFDSDTIDGVYHSHLLEHFDKDIACKFLLEVKRVLKAGGVHRIVVPDFEKACKAYVSHIAVCEKDPAEAVHHDSYIGAIIEQSIRREAFGTSQKPPFRRFVENLLLGDARKRGETHQWMYDRISLSTLLTNLGYRNPQLQQFNTSSIPNWNGNGLDLDENGNEYMPGSLYIEVEK